MYVNLRLQGQEIQWPKDRQYNGQQRKNKQWYTNHYIENWKFLETPWLYSKKAYIDHYFERNPRMYDFFNKTTREHLRKWKKK
jgi:hypothetical protein